MTQQATEMAAPARRGFTMLWASAIVSSVGDGAFVVAAPLLAAYLTRDPMSVALVSAAAAAPWFLIGFWSGAIVDRLPRRLVLVASDVVRALALAVLVALVITNTASVLALAVVSFVAVAGKCFFDAAAQASLPQVVSKERDALTRANGRLFAGETVGQTLIGPPLGGASFALAPWAPFAVDAVSFGASAAFVARIPALPAPEFDRTQSIRSAVAEGFKYLLRNRELVVLASCLAVYNVAYNLASATLVLFAQDELGVTDLGYGLLITAGATGAVVVGWTASPIVRALAVRGTVLASIAVQMCAWLALALAPSVWTAALTFALIGGSSTLITVAVVSARQQIVPDPLLGRVVSAFRLIGNGVAPVGAAAGGVVAGIGGLSAPLLAAPILLFTALLALAVPVLRLPR